MKCGIIVQMETARTAKMQRISPRAVVLDMAAVYDRFAPLNEAERASVAAALKLCGVEDALNRVQARASLETLAMVKDGI